MWSKVYVKCNFKNVKAKMNMNECTNNMVIYGALKQANGFYFIQNGVELHSKYPPQLLLLKISAQVLAFHLQKGAYKMLAVDWILI